MVRCGKIRNKKFKNKLDLWFKMNYTYINKKGGNKVVKKNMYITEEQQEKLIKLVEKTGNSESSLLRTALELLFKKEGE